MPSLGQEDPLEEERTTLSSVLAWEIPWTEEPGGPQSMESQKSRTRLSDSTEKYYSRLHSPPSPPAPSAPLGESAIFP